MAHLLSSLPSPGPASDWPLPDQKLEIALQRSNFKAAQSALREGADPRGRGPNPMRPLHVAAARLRFENSAEFDRQAIELIELLLSLGALVDELSPDRATPLIYAATANQPERAQILLKAGANPNHRDTAGLRPLDYAAFSDNAQLALHLLNAGADPRLCFNPAAAGSYAPLLARSSIPAFAHAWAERLHLDRSTPREGAPSPSRRAL